MEVTSDIKFELSGINNLGFSRKCSSAAILGSAADVSAPMMSHQTFLRPHVFLLTVVYSVMRAHVLRYPITRRVRGKMDAAG